MSGYRIGTTFDAGHAWAEIRRPFDGAALGVEIHPDGSRVLLPFECRKMATFLLLAADWCDKQNAKSKEATDGR